MNFQVLRNRNTPVVFERFGTGRFDIITDKRYVPDFDSFRSGKKSHIGRVVVQRIYEHSFFKNEITQSCLLRFQSAGQPDGPATNDKNIQYVMHVFKDKS